MKTLLSIFFVVSVCLFGYFFPDILVDVNPPKMKDGYFGKRLMQLDPENFPKDNQAIRKFEIKVEETFLIELKTRLMKTRYVDPLINVDFQYGFHPYFLQKVVEYWKTDFDWRAQEEKLNQFNQFVTQIEGLDIHFIHQKPNLGGKKIKVIPLVLIHGWPSSLMEFTKIIPLLTTPRKGQDFVFEVVCPSIPGYGFSEAPHHPGFGVSDAARVFLKLMDRLNIPKFYVHGGNWGIAISTTMAKLYPKRVSGIHINLITLRLGRMGWVKYILGYMFPTSIMTEREAKRFYPLSNVLGYLLQETGYMHIQATKPDTIGAALMDSPAGLAAYILEKFSTWTDFDNVEKIDGGLTVKFTLDELISNVMIYWCSGSITSSMRFDKEQYTEKERSYKLDMVPINTPTGISAFPNEFMALPRSLLEPHFRNVVRFTQMLRGGAFAAWEEPKLLADELFAFVNDVEDLPK